MFRNETEFRNHISKLLREDEYEVKKEFKVPEGYRVDLRARKKKTSVGIEVKFERRDIMSAINKCFMLHKLPEFDIIYVAAPKILISSDHIACAKRLRIGIFGVTENSIDELVQSDVLQPPSLMSSSGLLPGEKVLVGQVLNVTRKVTNRGGKVARNLEVFYMPGHPFARSGKTRYKKAKLGLNETWEVSFKIRIKKSTKPGTYPLYLTCTADNAERSDTVWEIEVQSERKIK